MDDLAEIRAEMLMLRHTLGSLWANILANSTDDPVATCARVAEESHTELESAYGRWQVGEATHLILQAVLHHQERFWTEVQSQLESRERSARGRRR